MTAMHGREETREVRDEHSRLAGGVVAGRADR